jgi:phthalate 4,5-cis-dihydrodiol dehydrogenase
MHHPHFVLLLVSCEKADLRPSPDGVLVYDDDGVHELIAPPARTYPNKDGVIDEFYDAIVSGEPPLHDGRWGIDTMAAAIALLQSARERRIIPLTNEERPHAYR